MKIRIGRLTKQIFLTYMPDNYYSQVLSEIKRIDEGYKQSIWNKVEEILKRYSKKDENIKKLLNDYNVVIHTISLSDKPTKKNQKRIKYTLRLLKKAHKL